MAASATDGIDLPDEVDVVVVGSGFSGIGMAIALRRAGVERFVVLDRGATVGGTWRDNHYPGAACDIASNLYSFSFAPNAAWTRRYSPQSEIWAYLARCVAEFDLARHLHQGHEVRSATFDADAERWDVVTDRGRVRGRVLVWAAGFLSEPRLPDLPGLSEFEGPVFHSAAWDHSVDLGGRRVAVVGTGASAVQFIPEIQPRVGRLTVHQRSAPWVVPRGDRAVVDAERRLFERLPVAQSVARAAVFGRQELLAPGLLGRSDRPRRMLRTVASAHLRAQVTDPGLRARLTPDYEIGCKRILLSDTYYPALTRDNVDVAPAAVAVGRHSVTDAEGTERPADVLVFATGFASTEPSFTSTIAGPGGQTLAERWRDGHQAYLGTAVSGFPNLFLLLGPNTGLGHNSMVFMIESQVRYIADAVTFLRRTGVGTVEVRRRVEDRYNRSLQGRMARTVWTTGGCQSWYLDRSGRNTALWPGATWRFRRLTARFDDASYRVRTPGALAGLSPETTG